MVQHIICTRSDSFESDAEGTRKRLKRGHPQSDRVERIVDQFRDYENVSLKGMVVVDTLGHGLCGDIWRVVLPTGELCAAKEMDATVAYLNECRLHRSLDHPSIVRFLGVSQLSQVSDYRRSHVLVTELLSMDLYQCKGRFPEIPLSITVSILGDIAEGMAYLHSLKPPVVHGDLAPRHILLTDHMRAKISGFGMAQVLDGTPLRSCPCRGLDMSFMPPESVGGYDCKLDVYSFGMLVVYIVATDSTVANYTEDEGAFDIVNREILRHTIRDHCLYPLTEQC